MKKSFRILLIVAVVLNVALIAAFTVPIPHHMSFVFDHHGTYDHYRVYDNGVFTNVIIPYETDKTPQAYTTYSHTITWRYPNKSSLDFSWLH